MLTGCAALEAGLLRLSERIVGSQHLLWVQSCTIPFPAASVIEVISLGHTTGRGKHLVDLSGYPVDGERASVTQTQC